MKKILKKVYPWIGVLIFLWIIKNIDFTLFRNEVHKINFFYLPLASVLYLPTIIFRAYRFKIMTGFQKIEYSLKKSFFIVGASTLLALVTPGRLGDFSKTIYLKKEGYSTGKSILSSLLEKIFDLLFIVLFGLGAIVFLPFVPRLSINHLVALKWGGLGLATCIILAYLFYKKSAVVKKILKDIWADFKKFKTKNILFVFLITSVTWIFYFFIIYSLATSVGLNKTVGFFYVSFLAVFSILAAILPISVMGLGTREAIFIFLLSPFGIAKETIILFSLLIMANYISLFLISFYCWLKKPLI
jgi:uncharacterized membrane protein YbhN (UPF0104 family)